jgi:tetratricopeptide (TPR) repeat protein
MNPYEILEITPNASSEEIKEAYHRLAKKWHPDRFMGPEHAEAEQRFRLLAEAFGMLKNTGRPIALATPAEVPASPTAPASEPPIALHSVPPAARSSQDWYDEAKAAYEGKDWSRSLSLIHYALKMDSEKVDFHLLLAKLLDRPGGDVRKLVQTLETILRLNPKEVESAIRLAEVYQTVGLSTKATRMWETVRRIAPGHKVFQQETKPSSGVMGHVKGLGDQFNELVERIKASFGPKKGK